MPAEIGLAELRALLDSANPQLVEVLPGGEYEEEHLPDAVNMPLKDFAARAAALDPRRPVIVYCWDDA